MRVTQRDWSPPQYQEIELMKSFKIITSWTHSETRSGYADVSQSGRTHFAWTYLSLVLAGQNNWEFLFFSAHSFFFLLATKCVRQVFLFFDVVIILICYVLFKWSTVEWPPYTLCVGRLVSECFWSTNIVSIFFRCKERKFFVFAYLELRVVAWNWHWNGLTWDRRSEAISFLLSTDAPASCRLWNLGS